MEKPPKVYRSSNGFLFPGWKEEKKKRLFTWRATLWAFFLLDLIPIIQSSESVFTTITSAHREVETEDNILLNRVKDYWQCKMQDTNQQLPLSGTKEHCESFFDGWVCWKDQKTGTTSTVQCPSYGQHVRSVSRNCSANATWEHILEEHPCAPRNHQAEAKYGRVIGVTEEIDLPVLYPYQSEGSTKSYESCIINFLSKSKANDGKGVYCPRTFDGWSCWNDTLAGEVARTQCPSFVMGLDKKRMAHKTCTVNGTWFRDPRSGLLWSNYTTCVDQDDLNFRNKIISLYVTGYSISVTALAISLVVFFLFRSLKCGRVTIHKNLFFSFIVNNTMWIIWYTCVVNDAAVTNANSTSCQALHVMIQYFLVSNYFWMFCEGFYLHTLLVLAFVAEVKIMRWLYVIGWGIPLALTIIYTCVRMSSDSDAATKFCLIDDHSSKWILYGPVILSMFLNFSFLINIVRVLVTKLRAVNSPDSNHTRKAVRATLILIPLLGLHYVIVFFRPDPGTSAEQVYEIMAAIVTSFQGFCVALLFCFFNGEVIALIRKRWKQEIMMRRKDRRTSYAATTTSWDGQDTSL